MTSMASSPTFKVPSAVPQDLQFIHNIIGDIIEPSLPKPLAISRQVSRDDDTDSVADIDTDSEREVEEIILRGVEDDEDPDASLPSESTMGLSSSSSSEADSDSDSDEETQETSGKTAKLDDAEMGEDEDSGPAISSESQVMTKSEVTEASIVIPDINEVGPDEVLEKVGEVMNIVGKVVIVKGDASQIANRASERALDSDTLLVFEDRKVLGYICETFGPTYQPLYQVKFSDQYPLDSDKVQISKPVFHVPARSNFVFVRALQRMKGSDASNVHDEEPADDEIEFSDDEAELAHKRALAQRREQSRTRSIASSRHATPIPSQMRDQDMADELYGTNLYDNSGPVNDMDIGAGPSRPVPMPYDDPYSDHYGVVDSHKPPVPLSSNAPHAHTSRGYTDGRHAQDRNPNGGRACIDRGRGREHRNGSSHGFGRRDDRGRGRGRDRDRRRGDRGRGWGRARDDRGSAWGADDWSRQQSLQPDEYDPRQQRSLSPTSLAIARATGQFADGTVMGSNLPSPSGGASSMNGTGWNDSQYSDQQQYDVSYSYQNQFVQPHINPRFASSFAMNFAYSPTQSHFSPYDYRGMGYSSATDSSSGDGWAQQWFAGSEGSPATGEGGS
ncbi:NAF1-domain-containing protein [Laetiporus sulphureus 93-53]|uniref:H/ACA ribonucleoprotein complex non-core subunit NAF1 n=1 Tax=Laetiporus sulphureus 93-53 TaxID=1314785 RepID=A0A165FBI7_9APHY|nr:NAF1-domain-containing protein [Laetiporus sulphureus 93-53]KZT08717.1 NAF1-domain-containing protein [Laetiporus sulphureus 93-53]